MSIRANVGRQGSSRRDVQAWISKAAWLPSQHIVATRSAIRCSFASRASTPTSRQRRSQPGADDGMSFCQNPMLPAPFGNRWRLSGRSLRWGRIVGAIRAK
jgi:hypothetical protein